MLLFPYQADVPMTRWPISNFILIGVISLISLMAIGESFSDETIMAMVCDQWAPTGMIGYMFLHAGFIHLLGNMIFLWVFGNAVCAKVGNAWYPPVFLGLGLLAATCHNLMDGGPVIGASGAINGIVGMFLIWYPLNDIRCFYLIVVRPGTFTVSSYWMILLWLAFDIWGLSVGGDGVAYAAHVGGFVVGALLAVVLLRMRRVTVETFEKTLLDCLGIAPPGRGTEELGGESLTRPARISASPASPQPPMSRRIEPVTPVGKIRFACDQCGHPVAVRVEHVGKKGRCPKCAAVLTIPAAGD